MNPTPAARPEKPAHDVIFAVFRATESQTPDPKPQKMSDQAIIVQVRRQPGDWRLARYDLADMSNLTWGFIGGGIQRRTQWHVYGYVWCNEKIDGRLAHSCRHGPPPHHIKVCVTKKFNEKIWPSILAIVGPKPMPRRQARRLKRSAARNRQPT